MGVANLESVAYSTPMVWAIGVVVYFIAGFLSLFFAGRTANWLFAGGSVAGGLVCAVAGAVGVWWGSDVEWAVPVASGLVRWTVGVDSLSGTFMMLSGVLGGVCAVYGLGYWRGDGRARVRLGRCAWLLMLAGIQCVAGARDGLVLLLGWELMSLSAFVLVNYEHERAEVREAGWAYLVASQLGVACLLVMVCLFGLGAGGDLHFAEWGFDLSSGVRHAIFLFALVGFGSKAGLIPMHVWLPLAHPAAPSHVSAMMSGVLIKMGIYGLLRVLLLLHYPAASWGWILFGLGGATAILGVVFALLQDDLKKLLAYSSVENVGIITMSFGLGVLGWSSDAPVLLVLGFAAGFLHLTNHAVAKAAMFLAAGNVVHATGGERSLNRLGGLMKRMPATGLLFMIGAATMAALPPFSLFSGEFTMFVGGVSALSMPDNLWLTRGVGLLLILVLALVGGLSCACFVKAAGLSFPGAARSEAAERAHEVSRLMLWPVRLLMAFCVIGGLIAGPRVLLAWYICEGTTLPRVPEAALQMLLMVNHTLVLVGCVSGILLGLCILLYWLHGWFLRGRDVRKGPTWDCGYVCPTARMQYTGWSFSEPLFTMFSPLLRPVREVIAVAGNALLPVRQRLSVSVIDPSRRYVIVPLLMFVRQCAMKIRFVQQGRVQMYILYLAGTLLFLLIWQLK